MPTCIAVSDFHMRDIVTPPADILIVGGDMTMMGETAELDWFTEWLIMQPQKHKIWIAGNHELGLERNPDQAEKIAEQSGSIYLNESMVEVEGVRIWGSPITPMFYNWAFMRDRGEQIRKHWLKIPEDLHVLVTHGPPFGIMDRTVYGVNAGCEELLSVITEKLTLPPRFHVFGHIHEGYGRTSLKVDGRRTIEMINPSICDERYKAVHAPIQFEIEI